MGWCHRGTSPTGNLDNYNEQAGIRLARGAEMGRFNMGSTVITLFGGNGVKLEENLKTNRPIEMKYEISSF